LNRERSGLRKGTSAITQVETKRSASSNVDNPCDGGTTLLTEVKYSRCGWLVTRKNAQEVGGSSSRPVNQERLAYNGADWGINGKLSDCASSEQQSSGDGGKDGLHCA